MAKIEKRENKKGTVYRIRVFDKRLRGGETSKTYKPEKEMTVRQAEKEANRQAVLFEETVKQLLDEQYDYRVKFKDIANEWLQRAEIKHTIKISTIERMKILKNRTYEAIGEKYINDINDADIQVFIDGLSRKGVNKRNGKGLSPKTQKHYLTFISDVMKYAVKMKKADKSMLDVCKNIEVSELSESEQEQKDKKVYSKDEVTLILNAIYEQANLQYRVMFSILAFYGLRRGELMGLEYKDINFSSGLVTIRRTSNYRNSNTGVYVSTPKNKSSYRFVYFSADVLELIKQLKREQQEQELNCGDLWNNSDRLFIQWNGEPMNPNTPYTFLERLCKREKIHFKGLHAFRHAYATISITSGEPINVVASTMGHSNNRTTLVTYTHEVQEATAKGMFTVENILKNTEKRQN